MLKSKILGATVSASSLEAAECLFIDRELMKLADIWPFEQVEVANADNGARLFTYAAEAEAGSGIIKITGPAAYLVKQGHRITISTSIQLDESRIHIYKPRVISLGAQNKPK